MDGERRNCPFVDVRRPDRDPIARFDVARQQRTSSLVDLVGELLERKPHVAVDDGFAVPETFSSACDELWNGEREIGHRPRIVGGARNYTSPNPLSMNATAVSAWSFSSIAEYGR